MKKGKVNHKDLFFLRDGNEYMYTNGWNYKAVYSLIIGFIFSFSLLGNINFSDIKSFSWILGFVVSFFKYYLLAEK